MRSDVLLRGCSGGPQANSHRYFADTCARALRLRAHQIQRPPPKHSTFPFIFSRTRGGPAGFKLVGRLKLNPAQLFDHLSQRSDTRFSKKLSYAFKMSTKHNCEMTAFPPSVTKNVFSPLASSHSRKHDGGRAKFWQVYFRSNNCARRHQTVTALRVFHYLEFNICHSVRKPLSLISASSS